MTETAVEYAARKLRAYRKALVAQQDRNVKPIYDDVERTRIGVWDMDLPKRCPICRNHIIEEPNVHLFRHNASFVSPEKREP